MLVVSPNLMLLIYLLVGNVQSVLANLHLQIPLFYVKLTKFLKLEVTNSKLNTLVEENKFSREKIDPLESRIAKLEAVPTALPDKMNLHIEIFSELQDRIFREKNILIFNVPESNVNEIDDNALVNDIFFNIDIVVPFTKIFRLGKVGPKPRPL